MSNPKAVATFSKSLFFGAALIFLGLLVLPVHAQAPDAAGQAGDLMQEVREVQTQIQQINQKLVEIQENTIATHPELGNKRDALMASVDDKMIEAGHDPESSRDKIENLESQLEQGELSQQESQAVTQQLRSEQASMRQAQGQAMQDPEVQAQVQSLNQELVAAMREQNPQTDELITQLQTAQQQYQTLMQQAMQNHGGGNPDSGSR